MESLLGYIKVIVFLNDEGMKKGYVIKSEEGVYLGGGVYFSFGRLAYAAKFDTIEEAEAKIDRLFSVYHEVFIIELVYYYA